MVSTIWALYCTDFTFLVLDDSADVPMAVVSMVVTAVFTMEIILNFVSHRDYGGEEGFSKFNLFFWLDIFGTASLLPEISVLLGSDFGAPKAAAVARAGRAARIGARMSRVVRFVRSKHLVCSPKARGGGCCCCHFESFDIIDDKINQVCANPVSAGGQTMTMPAMGA
jgi:hypothetical protein